MKRRHAEVETDTENFFLLCSLVVFKIATGDSPSVSYYLRFFGA